MMTEEWLSSELKLCQLVNVSDTAPSNDWNAEGVVINTQKYPELDYDYSSVFITLNAYTNTLYEACVRRSNLIKKYRAQNSQEHNHVKTDILDHYAEMLCGDILDMAKRRRGSQSTEDGMMCCLEKAGNNQTDQSEVNAPAMSNQDKQAEMLAAEIYSRVLEEIALHNSLTSSRLGELPNAVLPKQMDQVDSMSEVHGEPVPRPCSPTHQPEMEEDTKKMGGSDRTHSHDRPVHDAGSRDQSSGSSSYCNVLNGLTPMGSLDYPDAPPSTPLLPGMMKSRDSFSRKLKGGLAKEFMPSPPPPTPKDQQAESLLEDKMAETPTNNSEFMLRLMRSLSLACKQCGDIDEEEQGTKDEGEFQTGITTLPDYAARLCADIVHCITTTQPCVCTKKETPVRDVQFLADHLAEEIILMSVAEVIGSKGLHGKIEQSSPSLYTGEQMPNAEDRTQVLGNTLVPRSSPDVPAMEILRALSGKLVDNILVQAFSELGVGAFQDTSSHQFLAASEPLAWTAGYNQYPNSCLNTTKSHEITALDLGTQESEADCITGDTRAGTLTAEHSFAESFVDEVLQHPIQETSNQTKHLSNQTSIISGRLPSSDHSVVRGIISGAQSHEIQELQCMVLWAATSHMGTSVLQLQLPEGHIQQQLCRLSLRARFHGWTVGVLMESLLEYCEDLQAASRGHCKRSGSLLGHLLLCVN